MLERWNDLHMHFIRTCIVALRLYIYVYVYVYARVYSTMKRKWVREVHWSGVEFVCTVQERGLVGPRGEQEIDEE